MGSASVWDEQRRAGHGKDAPPDLSSATLPSAVELAALVSGIVQVTLDTRLADSSRERRAELGRELEQRLLSLLGVTPGSFPGPTALVAEPQEVEADIEAPSALEEDSAGPAATSASSSSSRALEQVLEERLGRLGGTLATRPDLRRRLIELAVSTTMEPTAAADATAEELRRLDLLQRRATKLERSLHDARAALAYVSGLEHVDTGLASIYRSVQGISGADPQRERKRGALEAIFQANLRLQKQPPDAAG